MTEKVEIVTTRVYNQKDLATLLGEGKKDVSIYTGFSRENGPVLWRLVGVAENEVLKVEIREPYEVKK